MYYLISSYYLLKAFCFLFCAFLFMPLALVNPYCFANGIHQFAIKLIDDLRRFEIISEEQADKCKDEIGS